MFEHDLSYAMLGKKIIKSIQLNIIEFREHLQRQRDSNCGPQEIFLDNYCKKAYQTIPNEIVLNQENIYIPILNISKSYGLEVSYPKL